MNFISRIAKLVRKESLFLVVVVALFIIAAFIYPYANVAMWFGFIIAAYAAVSNDSIQTLGTFIASNTRKPWYLLWLYIGTLFLITVITSWVLFDGDVSSGRLLTTLDDGSLAFPQPDKFNMLQLLAPIFLLVLTRLRMPVSTTFLLLTSFAIRPSAIEQVIGKSINAYFIAFIAGLIIWLLITGVSRKYFQGKPSFIWVILQWITSGTLWSVWIMQDAANLAIYLPRSLSVMELVFFCIIIFCGLGLIFYLKGDRIQRIVDEKSEVRDIRAATIIDFVYALILIYKLFISTVPMSTTWVFIGLLGGRELGIRIFERIKGQEATKRIRHALWMLFKDFGLATIGLIISVLIASAVNPFFRDEILSIISR